MRHALRQGGSAALAVLLILSAALPVCAQKLKLPEIKYEKYTLPNGLTVITHEDHRLPLVAVDLWYHVGPLNERAGRTGFAHLFEHMMFEGSEHVGEKAHIKYVEAAGATDVNGTTSFDRTNYFETMPSNQLELALWLESDRMGFLMEGLNRTLLTNQRDVVRNERRQGEGRPYYVANEAVYARALPRRASVLRQRDGQSHRYRVRAHRGCARLPSAVLHAQQCLDRHRRRLRSEGAARDADEVLRSHSARACAAAGECDDATDHIAEARHRHRYGEAAADPLRLAHCRLHTRRDSTTPTLSSTRSAEPRRAASVRRSSTSRRLAQSVNCGSDSLKLTGMAQCIITARPGVKLEDIEGVFWKELQRCSRKDRPQRR